MRSGSIKGEIPKTGITLFDRLVKDSEEYIHFRDQVEKAGFTVEEVSIGQGFRGQFDVLEKTCKINVAYFTYLDLMHETRHLQQILRAVEQGIEWHKIKRYLNRVIAGLEYDAYQYELHLLAEVGGVNEAYLEFVNDQLYNSETGYYNVSMQKKISLSDVTQSIIQRLIPE